MRYIRPAVATIALVAGVALGAPAAVAQDDVGLDDNPVVIEPDERSVEPGEELTGGEDDPIPSGREPGGVIDPDRPTEINPQEGPSTVDPNAPTEINPQADRPVVDPNAAGEINPQEGPSTVDPNAGRVINPDRGAPGVQPDVARPLPADAETAGRELLPATGQAPALIRDDLAFELLDIRDRVDRLQTRVDRLSDGIEQVAPGAALDTQRDVFAGQFAGIERDLDEIDRSIAAFSEGVRELERRDALGELSPELVRTRIRDLQGQLTELRALYTDVRGAATASALEQATDAFADGVIRFQAGQNRLANFARSAPGALFPTAQNNRLLRGTPTGSGAPGSDAIQNVPMPTPGTGALPE